MHSVTVLMSTYNGEKYLREQLDSIIRQRNVELRLIIRDDVSTDNTICIIREYIKKYDNIKFIQGDKNLGACKSFLELMTSRHDTDYIALADQDDIWDSDKLECAIKKLETEKNGGEPLLYYSNLRIVDKDKNFCRLAHKKPRTSLSKYSCLLENLPTGNTMLYNQELSKLIYDKNPDKCGMHDSWLFLVASLFGKCIYDFEPHINYRIHSNNEIGTSKKYLSLETVKRIIKDMFDYKAQPRYESARSFYKLYGGVLDERTKTKVLNIVNYKRSAKNTLKILFDSDLNSNIIHKRLRLKIKICLHNI